MDQKPKPSKFGESIITIVVIIMAIALIIYSLYCVLSWIDQAGSFFGG